jgi:hypothetical protein
MSESDEFLIATMAYCLSWEISGTRAKQAWSGIREYISMSNDMSDTERWMCELYEESGPTAQEERSIISRLNARIIRPRASLHYQQSILALLPDSFVEVAKKHRLIGSLSFCEEASSLRRWLAQYKISSLPAANAVPLASLSAREHGFLEFIEHPYFLEGFRRYWHQHPKFRNNAQMRVLLCVAAAISQMVTCEDIVAIQSWVCRLSQICHYAEQTQQDLTELSFAMLNESYDAQELAYRLFVDARSVDQTNIITFCQRYADELTGFAHELVRGLQLAL